VISRSTEELSLFTAEFPPLTRRRPGIKVTAPQYLTLRHQTAGGKETARLEHGPVHDDGTHADQTEILNLATMQDNTVANRNPIADDAWSNAMTGMEDAMILDVGTGANPDIMHIAAKHGLEPDAGIIANPDSAHDIR